MWPEPVKNETPGTVALVLGPQYSRPPKPTHVGVGEHDDGREGLLERHVPHTDLPKMTHDVNVSISNITNPSGTKKLMNTREAYLMLSLCRDIPLASHYLSHYLAPSPSPPSPSPSPIPSPSLPPPPSLKRIAPKTH